MNQSASVGSLHSKINQNDLKKRLSSGINTIRKSGLGQPPKRPPMDHNKRGTDVM
jgi:hypothetical protein